ncbi:MAG: serine/threonine protein kinase [Nitrososphaera sp.]
MARLSLHNISFSDNELDIRSPKLLNILSYPRYSQPEYKDRIREMESLGITSIILGGRTILNGTQIAGKGCVGIVVKSKAGSKVCALKIRRIDADRNTMDNEARFHEMANSAGVGPKLMGYTKNLIAMEFVRGPSIIDWLEVDHNNYNYNAWRSSSSNNNNDATRSKVGNVSRAILEQCFSLDTIGLDHGELSRMARHVIVSNRPYIIDFESASNTRKTSNVTSAAQSIFLYGTVANRVKKVLGAADREKVIDALRTYKQTHTRANFDSALDSLMI